MMRVGSRWSGKRRANRSASPRRCSAIDSSMTPPSDVRRPPSKAAVTFLREMAGNENGRRLSSVMAGAAGAKRAEGWYKQLNLTPYHGFTPRSSPSNRPVMNKMGYSLSNGGGKVRAGRDGGMREPKSWRVMVLSTGELPVEAKLSEDRGRKAKAG